MRTEWEEPSRKAIVFDALTKPKYIAMTFSVLALLALWLIVIRGDSWSKWTARVAARDRIENVSEKRGPDDNQTIMARRSYVWLLIHQKFPVAARKEYNRYIADLGRLAGKTSFDLANERFLTACEFRSSGFPEIAIDEFSAIEAEEGYSYCGINTSRFLIVTLMEIGRYSVAEAKCRQILADSERLSLIRRHHDWEPWAFLAKCLAAQGKHPEAESAFKSAIGLSAESWGREHFRTHALRVQLAHSLAKMGRKEEALALARQALPVFESYRYSGFENVENLREFISLLE